MTTHFGRIAVALALTGAAGLGMPACQTNAATGRKFFTTMSPQEEIALGAQAAPQLSQEFGGPVPDAEVQAYVRNIGKNLAKQTEAEYPGLPWEFTLLNSGVINAFSLPGGKVFISRALMEKMTDEAQLAGVLGHEIGHVTAQHVAQHMGNAQLAQVGLGVAGMAVPEGGVGQLVLPALNVGGQLLLLKFSRTDETQADSLGMRYMSRAGYNPTGQLQVMQILASSGGGKSMEMLQTHPLPETRIKQVQELLNTTYKDMVNNPNYKTYPERFAPMLARLKRLPPAPEPKPSGGTKGSQLRGGRAAPPPPQERVISRPAR